jgi:hypothetical protein
MVNPAGAAAGTIIGAAVLVRGTFADFLRGDGGSLPHGGGGPWSSSESWGLFGVLSNSRASLTATRDQ